MTRAEEVWQEDVDRIVEALQQGPAIISALCRRLGIAAPVKPVFVTLSWMQQTQMIRVRSEGELRVFELVTP